MIPRTLQLKNFLSYGPEIQTIDFSDYPLICLSGKNGHGKSALLDAITWALWGQARKVSDVSKADEGLLRLGQTQMLVILDFEFNGQRYRVRREFAKTYGKPHAVLDFGIVNEAETFIPLTEKTIRGTQAKIESMLNLDADSFINSAFLRQGQSNEFSKKSSKDRKEILASILGINRYETLRKAALEKVKIAQGEQYTLSALQTSIEQELSQKELICTQLAQAAVNLARSNAQEAVHEQEKIAVKNERSEMQLKQQHLQMLSFKLEQHNKEAEQQLQALQTTRYEWRAIHKKALTLTNQDVLETTKKQLVNAITNHQQTLQKNLELKEALLDKKEKVRTIEKQIMDAHVSLMSTKKSMLDRLILEKEVAEKKIIELEQELNKQSQEKKQVVQDAKKLQLLLAGSEEFQRAHAVIEKQFEKRKEYYQKFIAQGNWLKTELASLEQKKRSRAR